MDRVFIHVTDGVADTAAQKLPANWREGKPQSAPDHSVGVSDAEAIEAGWFPFEKNDADLAPDQVHEPPTDTVLADKLVRGKPARDMTATEIREREEAAKDSAIRITGSAVHRLVADIVRAARIDEAVLSAESRATLATIRNNS